jgi:hypothetical protein
VGGGVLEGLITPPAAGSYRLSLLSESQGLPSDGRSGAALRVGPDRRVEAAESPSSLDTPARLFLTAGLALDTVFAMWPNERLADESAAGPTTSRRRMPT